MKKLRRQLYLRWRGLLGHDTERFAPHGITIRIPAELDHEIRYRLSHGRPFEQPEAQMVRRHLAPCQNVIELGGCFGLISAVIRQAIGPDARHIVVEADAGLARACAENAVIGANPQCTSTIVAAVDYSGRDTVTFQTGHNAHVGHVPGAGEVGATGKPVATTTLRKLAALLPDGPFALVCDIEGTELALFQADADLLPRITLLVLETHPKVYSGGEADLAQMVATITASGLRVVEEAEQVICFTRSAT